MIENDNENIHGKPANVLVSGGLEKIDVIGWLRYYILRSIIILTMADIMPCVRATYAVRSSYGYLKQLCRYDVPYTFHGKFTNFFS